jgi:negative regulator of sigma E activity
MSEDFEKQLRDALRPVDPEDGFANRVMARIEMAKSRRRRWVSTPSRWFPVALAASVVLAVAVLLHQRHLREERAGLEARQQLIEALRISGEKLDLAYRVVNTEPQPPSSDDTGA